VVVDGGILPPLSAQKIGGKIHLEKFKVQTEKRKVRENENSGIRHPYVFTCSLCTSLGLHA